MNIFNTAASAATRQLEAGLENLLSQSAKLNPFPLSDNAVCQSIWQRVAAYEQMSGLKVASLHVKHDYGVFHLSDGDIGFGDDAFNVCVKLLPIN